MGELMQGFCHTGLFALVITCVAISGFTDRAVTEDGIGFYAEKPWDFMYNIIPALQHIPMPLNTAVNFLYMLVGLYWMNKFEKLNNQYPGSFVTGDLYMQHVFHWIAIFYGNVQLLRILTQHHTAAILDQWFTLPIFVWTLCMCRHLSCGWNVDFNLHAIRISSLSYALALVHPFGFELALAFHIAAVIYVAFTLIINMEVAPKGARAAFVKCCIACVGFVLLKVFDLYLPNIHVIFNYVSGHFISKVFDCLQFHFCSEFMHYIYTDRFLSKQKTK